MMRNRNALFVTRKKEKGMTANVSKAVVHNKILKKRSSLKPKNVHKLSDNKYPKSKNNPLLTNKIVKDVEMTLDLSFSEV